MFALQPSVGVFEDELQEYKVARGVTSKSLDDSKAKQSSSAGASSSAAQLSKPKRKALANITNDSKANATGSAATAKSASLQEAVKLPVALPPAALCADGHLDTPEKLSGPSGADQEVLVAKADDNQLEDRVQRILQLIEGAPEDGICDMSRDEDDDILQCLCESTCDESTAQIPLDLLNTLPDMQAPSFLDLLE